MQHKGISADVTQVYQESSLTCAHEVGNAESAAEHAVPQRLERRAVEGQCAADQHVQDDAQTLKEAQTTSLASSSRLYTRVAR